MNNSNILLLAGAAALAYWWFKPSNSAPLFPGLTGPFTYDPRYGNPAYPDFGGLARDFPEMFPGGGGQIVRPDWTDPELLPPPDPDTAFASNIFQQFDPAYDGPPRYW